MDKLKKEAVKEEVKKPVVKAAAKKTATKAASKKVEAKTEGAETVKKVLPKGSVAMKVIVRPLITEKAAHLQAYRTYAFVVTAASNKPEIRQAVKELYGVEPIKVRVVNMQGKAVRSGKSSGRRQDFKKAMVTLKLGESITIHEGV